jgi:hypothetical protein
MNRYWIIEKRFVQSGWRAVAICDENPSVRLGKLNAASGAQYRCLSTLPDLNEIERAAQTTLADVVGEYHRSRGCCDGSDPNACFDRQQKAHKEADEKAKAERQAKRRSGWVDEFDDTD